MSINDFKIIPLYCVSVPGDTWQCGLKYTGINLQTLQDKDLILIKENNISGGISSIMGGRYGKSDENKKTIYIDVTNLYGISMIEPLSHDEIEMWHGDLDLHMNKLEEILNNPDENCIGCFLEVDLRYPDVIREKTKNFLFCTENKFIPNDKYNDYMDKIKPKSYTKIKKLTCDWFDKKSF